MGHYRMDPVTERPVPCERPRKKRLVELTPEEYERLQKQGHDVVAEKEQTDSARQNFPCPSGGCQRLFSSERAMQTHFGRMHKKEKAAQSLDAAKRGASAAAL